MLELIAVAWPLSLQMIQQPNGPSSTVAWPLSLQMIQQPNGPSSAIAWPLSLQLTSRLVTHTGHCSSAVVLPLSIALTWRPIDYIFTANIIIFDRQSEQRAYIALSRSHSPFSQLFLPLFRCLRVTACPLPLPLALKPPLALIHR